MVAHGLITAALLRGRLGEGALPHLEIKRLGGLLLQAPHLGWILGFCTMASLGLPGLAGFWGEFPAILSTYNPAPGLSVGLFRTFMVIAAVARCWPPATSCGSSSAPLRRASEEFAGHSFHDVNITECWRGPISWDPRAGHLPAPDLPRHRSSDDRPGHTFAALGK